MNPATLEVEQAVVPKHLQSPCLRKIPCNVVGTVVDEWVDDWDRCAAERGLRSNPFSQSRGEDHMIAKRQ